MDKSCKERRGGIDKLSKHLWYTIIRRWPLLMQEDIDTYDIGPKWSSIVEHYWWKRFVANKISPTQRYRESVMMNVKYKTGCKECNKLYSPDAVDKCWRCLKYTCSSCVEIILRPDYPNICYPISCVSCVTRCFKCKNPFIRINDEIHCFECQYKAEMFTVQWANRQSTVLPYGTHALKNLYKTYLKSIGEINPPVRSTYVATQNAMGTNIAIGTGIAIGTQSMAIGHSAIIQSNNNDDDVPTTRPVMPITNSDMDPIVRLRLFRKYQRDFREWKRINGI